MVVGAGVVGTSLGERLMATAFIVWLLAVAAGVRRDTTQEGPA